MSIWHLLIINPVLTYIDSLIQFNKVIDMSQSPTFLEMLPQLLIMLFMEDFFFFSFHYLLHTKTFYRFHKHHHEHTTTTTFAGLDSHTFEYILVNIIPAAIFMTAAEVIAPLHVTTMTLWIIYRTWDGFNSHSGYNFTWDFVQVLPFCTNDDFHDFHHTFNAGNLSSTFRFWDCVFATNKDFQAYERAREAKALKATKTA